MHGHAAPLVTHGIIVAENYARAILEGRKTWEMRTRRWSHRGLVGIIVSGSGKVFGTAELANCVELPDDEDTVAAAVDRHLVADRADLRSETGALRRFAWVLRKPRLFGSPIPYAHKAGSQTPVKFSDEEKVRLARAAAPGR